MRWKFVAENPHSDVEDDFENRIVLEGMEGEDTALHYINDVAVFCAAQNIRSGYDIEVKGSCHKGPCAIQWGPIVIRFDDAGIAQAVRDHVLSIWGPENQDLGEVGGKSLSRLS